MNKMQEGSSKKTVGFRWLFAAGFGASAALLLNNLPVAQTIQAMAQSKLSMILSLSTAKILVSAGTTAISILGIYLTLTILWESRRAPRFVGGAWTRVRGFFQKETVQQNIIPTVTILLLFALGAAFYFVYRGEHNQCNKEPAMITYPSFTVDYERSVEDAVKLGHYDWADDNINSRNFPTERKGTADITVELGYEIIPVTGLVPIDEILCKIDKKGYRPIDIRELLAFSEKYPDVQREFSITAYSFIRRERGNRYAPCLFEVGSERRLSLGCIEYRGEYCHLAVVRKSD